jgi:hypothetical protein
MFGTLDDQVVLCHRNHHSLLPQPYEYYFRLSLRAKPSRSLIHCLCLLVSQIYMTPCIEVVTAVRL